MEIREWVQKYADACENDIRRLVWFAEANLEGQTRLTTYHEPQDFVLTRRLMFVRNRVPRDITDLPPYGYEPLLIFYLQNQRHPTGDFSPTLSQREVQSIVMLCVRHVDQYVKDEVWWETLDGDIVQSPDTMPAYPRS